MQTSSITAHNNGRIYIYSVVRARYKSAKAVRILDYRPRASQPREFQASQSASRSHRWGAAWSTRRTRGELVFWRVSPNNRTNARSLGFLFICFPGFRDQRTAWKSRFFISRVAFIRYRRHPLDSPRLQQRYVSTLSTNEPSKENTFFPNVNYLEGG